MGCLGDLGNIWFSCVGKERSFPDPLPSPRLSSFFSLHYSLSLPLSVSRLLSDASLLRFVRHTMKLFWNRGRDNEPSCNHCLTKPTQTICSHHWYASSYVTCCTRTKTNTKRGEKHGNNNIKLIVTVGDLIPWELSFNNMRIQFSRGVFPYFGPRIPEQLAQCEMKQSPWHLRLWKSVHILIWWTATCSWSFTKPQLIS